MATIGSPKVICERPKKMLILGPISGDYHKFGDATTIIGQDPVADSLLAIKVAKYSKWPR